MGGQTQSSSPNHEMPPPPPAGDPDASSTSMSDSSAAGAGLGLGLGAGFAGAGSDADSGAHSGSWSGSDSDNHNGNFNGNLDGNINGNLNANLNYTDVVVHDTVDVGVSLQDPSSTTTYTTTDTTGQSYDTNSFNPVTYNMSGADSPLNIAPSVNFLAGGGDSFNFSGSGPENVFHVDQVNGLVANNVAYDIGLTNNAGFSQSAYDIHGGSAASGGIGDSVGDTVSGSVASAASATATLTAFTQNVVLGANIQYNSLSQSAVSGSVSHTATATLADPSANAPGGDDGGWHHSS